MSTATLPGNIQPTSATAAVGSTIITAAANPVLTVVTTSVAIIPNPTGTAIPTPETVATTTSITDSASYAALTATTTPSSTFSSITTKPSTSLSSTSSAPGPTSSSSSSQGVLTANYAPFAIACAIVGLILLLLIFIWIRRVRRKRKAGVLGVTSISQQPHEAETINGKAELPGYSAKQGGVLVKAELITNANRHELDARQGERSTNSRAELVGFEVGGAHRT